MTQYVEACKLANKDWKCLNELDKLLGASVSGRGTLKVPSYSPEGMDPNTYTAERAVCVDWTDGPLRLIKLVIACGMMAWLLLT